MIIEEEAIQSINKLASSSAEQQANSEISILRSRLEKEERSIKKEAEEVAKKRKIREAEIEKRIQDDKYMRIPIGIGSVFAFKIKFFVFYIETNFILSVDHSYRTKINKIYPGFRFGSGIQFEFFNGRFFFGANVRYWLIHNSFVTFGPRIGFRI